MTGWGTFAVVMGAAAASLLGLLFVAVSIRVETIAGSAELRNRSAQTMALLLAGLLAAALVTVPDQRTWILGAEYLALVVAVGGVTFVLDRRTGTPRGSGMGHVWDAHNPTYATSLLLAIAALILILGHTGGIYLLVPTLIVVLAGGVANAWLILVRMTD